MMLLLQLAAALALLSIAYFSGVKIMLSMQENKNDAPAVKTTEKKAFDSLFHSTLVPTILADLDSFNIPQSGRDWIRQMMLHAVPDGKANRGFHIK